MDSTVKECIQINRDIEKTELLLKLKHREITKELQFLNNLQNESTNNYLKIIQNLENILT